MDDRCGPAVPAPEPRHGGPADRRARYEKPALERHGRWSGRVSQASGNPIIGLPINTFRPRP